MRGFELGSWTVFPERNLIRQGDIEATLELKVMNVLVVLASHRGEVVSKDQLVDAVWDGRATSDEVITRCISKIRGAFSDDPKNPTFIENVRGRGYRLIAPLSPLHVATQAPSVSSLEHRWRRPLFIGLAVAATIALVMSFFDFNSTDSAPIESVAVMPFKNLSSVDDQYLCEGFTEELIYALSGDSALRVAKGNRESGDINIESTAEQLGVDGIVTGSLRREGQKVRVTVQLHDGRSGFSRWSEVFDDSLNDTFKLQERVADGVLQAIAGKSKVRATVQQQPGNPEAYITYLRARYFLNQRTPETIHLAIKLFQEAIDGDPSFGMAYLGKAYAYLLLPSYSKEPEEAMFQQAIQAVDDGVEKDPAIKDTAEGVRGFIYHKRGQWGMANSSFKRALEAPSAYPITNIWYSRYLASVGLLEQSLEQARLARQLDPLSPVCNSRLAMAYLWIDDMDNAGKYFTIANQLGMATPVHFESYALYLMRLGKVSEAQTLIQKVLGSLNVKNSWVEPVFAAIGHPENRSAAVRALSSAAAQGTVSPREQVVLWAVLDEPEKAHEIARLLVGGGEAFEPDLLFIEELKPLRMRPEFSELLASIGLTEFWAQIGCRWKTDKVVCRG